MKFKVNPLALASGLAAIVAATVTFGVPAVKSQNTATVKIDGSSTVFPISEAVAEDFQNANRNVNVTVGVSGTGGGIKKFCAGEIDIANASRPIKAEEMEVCKKAGIQFIELPIAYDALTVVVNSQNPISKLTFAELKKMWEKDAQGKIKNWNQVNPSWPNAPLNLYGPGADSGTFDYFTEVINGKAKESRGDYTASEDDNVLVQGISRDRNSLGYFGYAYYEANQKRLKAVPIAKKDGDTPVMPSVETVKNNSYPLSRPLLIYVSAKAADRPEIKQFIQFYLSQAPRLVTEVQYIPLPDQAYQLAGQHFNNKKLGSVFVGRSTVGISIEELLRLETTL
ncbi:MAG TPA: protein sphX [Cyanobacteria bacterium UBA11149]|nr:protein sphX [Cyanobacteria bacterium UBA11367]HBE58000.1 protein sphX [Cyanobacteria bacterium UBA11366]HBK62474.1 protein sphX [Cyanobacteria bacterium UBA11166]HBR73988.1 protein sphX [Cyanobacteria bacterium UBA11159]HBS72110.1 protein sphX [Cyanobacteria bacterium UBA11153]HBW91285.1 protein sphX [Cyanobacteria bacterium UBA11149]HCA96237.1 protein sphX [Cyanobacteria bacterium UBA9226]